MPHLETLTLESYFFNNSYITDKMLNMLADTAVVTTYLNDQPDEPFLPKLRSLKYTGFLKFSWPCLPIVFGRRGTWEPGASEPSQSNRRPLHSFRMDLYTNQKPEESIIAELKHLNVEEGYDINIWNICDSYYIARKSTYVLMTKK